MFLMKDVLKEKRYSTTNGKVESKTIVSPSNKYVISKKTESKVKYNNDSHNHTAQNNYYEITNGKTNKFANVGNKKANHVMRSTTYEKKHNTINSEIGGGNNRQANSAKMKQEEVFKRPSSAPRMIELSSVGFGKNHNQNHNQKEKKGRYE